MSTQLSPRRAARGFTLIEVLISILIFSLGILGAIGMHTRLQQSTTQNGDRARAAVLANELASLMWLHQTTDPSTIAAFQTEYAAWQTRVSTPQTSGLPNGVGSSSLSGKIATITITWKPTNQAVTTTNTFKTSVVLP